DLKERGAQAAAGMLNSLDLEGRPQDTRVVVAMSGGVDSSVTAALLKAEGYDVVGVTLQLYDHGAATHRKGACCAGQDIHDARALSRAKEEERDQSYFLFGTTHAQLDLLRFPLGDLGKAKTRELARQFGLAVADKHDSQDICFVPTGRYTDVIERLKPGAAAAGDVVDLDGKVLGRHDGIIHFTIGQRRGLKIAGPARLYVVA